MSYDLYLFRRSSTEKDEDAIERLFFDDSDEINPGLPVPEKEERKRMLAESLIRANLELSVFKFGYAELAKVCEITKEEAKVRYRHLELNGSDDGNGIQITLYDDAATLTIPYWHEKQEAEDTFNEVLRYLKLFQSEAGYSTYDPQLERVLDLSTGIGDVLSAYAGGVSFTQSVE